MQLIDDLRREHILIEQVVGALRTYVATPNAPAVDAPRFLSFFRLFAGDFHHAREENVLFNALVTEVGVPRKGPLDALAGDHRTMAALLGAFEAEADVGKRAQLANQYGDALLHHIDAENSVLFTESEERLRRAHVPELAGRPPTSGELAAKATGEALVDRYPPSENPALIRGGGCVMCPACGVTCDGIELTWWNDSEWEDVIDRVTSG